jgi:hypothetical protein
MGIRVVRGRTLDDRDHAGATTVLINHAMAEKFWPGKDPIGKRFGQGNDLSKWYEVVGVLSDVRSLGLARNTPYEFYRTVEESIFNGGGMTVVVRTRGDDPTAIVPAARQIVASIDPALPLNQIQTMEHVVERVGGAAAADVGLDGAVRCAGRAAGDGRCLRRHDLQRAAGSGASSGSASRSAPSNRGCATSWSAEV